MKSQRHLTALFLLLAALVVPHEAFARDRGGKAFAPSGKKKMLAEEPEELPKASEGWKTACDQAAELVALVKPTLLADRAPGSASWRYENHKYTPMPGGGSYGDKMCNWYFGKVVNGKNVADVIAAVDGMAQTAGEYRKKNAPLLEKAIAVELGLKAVWLGLADGKAMEKKLEIMKETRFAGNGEDELSFSLCELTATVEAGKAEDAARWAGEAFGAAARLADLLRWVDLQTEWFQDLAVVFHTADPCINNLENMIKQQGGRWQNFMFARLPGCISLQVLSYQDALMVDYLLADFYQISETETAAMGRMSQQETLFCVMPAYRSAFAELMRAQAKDKHRELLAQIPLTRYEISTLNGNLWRYAEENQVESLAESLNRFFKQYRNPDVCTVMEVIHISQGAFAASTSAADRYHPKVVAWAAEVEGKPEKAAQAAYELVHQWYGGQKNYKGGLWTLHASLAAGKTDCIRISQMIGCIFADAGYAGVHPIRICRGNLQMKAFGNAHTFLNFDFGKKNLCYDGLLKNGGLKPFETMHAGDNKILSCSKGYRSLAAFVGGEIYFPMGPHKPVQLRLPYYGLARDGF